MTDIVDRLRAAAESTDEWALVKEAADEIARLRAALRMVLMLKQLGGMMPGSREIVQTIVEAAESALEKP